MNRDYMYVFDKLTFKRYLLGEIQTEFNMCQTIDGTKDSCTNIVSNFSDIENEPYSICWHEQTNTWWIVSHDKIERMANEPSTNESNDGFIYTHNLELLGAIELLNARDLTDCGFNDNTYTIRQFITRLFKLSNFEYTLTFDSSISSNFLDKKVDFVKTFENYTLYSALREFLDAYNCCAKLTFNTSGNGNNVHISSANLIILQKTGNQNLTNHDIDYFNDIKETKTMDKNSFGTCVISNANNVISSQAKTYPSTGLVGLSANAYDVDFDSALLRLPSNVYKVNWLKLVATKMIMTIQYTVGGMCCWIPLYYDNIEASMQNIDISLETSGTYFYYFNPTLKELLDQGYITQEDYDYIKNNKRELIEKIKKFHEIVFYDGIQYNPDNTFTKPDKVPYIVKMLKTEDALNDYDAILCSKDVWQNLESQENQGIYWERGSNLLQNFKIFKKHRRIDIATNTDGGYENQGNNELYSNISLDGFCVIYANARGTIGYGGAGSSIVSYEHPSKLFFNLNGKDEMRENTNLIPSTINNKPLFIINYVPMVDMKIKVDNQRNKRDIQLYNQNGKLSDSFALSKLLNSYSKEISSDNITRYGQYYDFDAIPKVGSFVIKGNETYVINNVSMTFYPNEYTHNEFGYFIDCEFNLSKYVSTKSLMVSPNTNIRDYGIPQNFNVKRKQLYRDYYELAYQKYEDANKETPYIDISNMLKFNNEYIVSGEYIVFIKTTFGDPLGTPPSKYWYYQLDCSTFILGKQLLLLCDFNDNNIIGYSQSNRDFYLNLSTLFSQDDLNNVPISYVDDNGKVEGFELLFIEKTDREILSKAYYNENGYVPFPTYDVLMTQVFIPSDLYEMAYDDEYYSFMLELEDYEKDATEVPVFEYEMQIDDSDDVLIGDNILQKHDGYVYFYSYVKGQNLTQNNVIDTNRVEPDVNFTRLEIYNGVSIEYDTIGDNQGPIVIF